jgi:hypothetical protein
MSGTLWFLLQAFPHFAGTGATGAAKEPPKRNAVTSEQLVKTVENPTEHWPACGSKEPAETDSPVSLAEGLDLAHNTAIRENAVDDAHDLLACHSISRRHKGGRGNVFESQAALPVPTLEPAYLETAERALPVIKQLETAFAHRWRSRFDQPIV